MVITSMLTGYRYAPTKWSRLLCRGFGAGTRRRQAVAHKLFRNIVPIGHELTAKVAVFVSVASLTYVSRNSPFYILVESSLANG